MYSMRIENLKMKCLSQLLTFFFLALIPITLSSQVGSIRGHIYDASNGEPIIFANIVVEGTQIGVNSDDQGFFTLTDIPVGENSVLISYIAVSYTHLTLPTKA